MRYLLVFTVFLYVFNISTENNLKQLFIFFRHGERTPTETYPNDPYKELWKKNWGQLTNKGKNEMYTLGKIIRKKYGDFISEYYWSSDVEILSSYADRCLNSMQLFLAGLFPPAGDQIWNEELLWQAIAVKYVPRHEDNMIAAKKLCANYIPEFINAYRTDKMMELDRNNADLYDYLTDKTGFDVKNISVIETLYNTLEIELLHNLTLPEWTKTLDWNRMRMLGARNLAIYTDNTFMKRIKGGVFLKHVINEMDKYRDGHGKKLFLYAGHDISIVHILRTLGVIDLLKPDFGASFTIELRKDDVIKIFYKDNINVVDEELILPNCKSPCKLGDFKRALTDVLPSDWERDCNN